jgi:hypothetical protein
MTMEDAPRSRSHIAGVVTFLHPLVPGKSTTGILEKARKVDGC